MPPRFKMRLKIGWFFPGPRARTRFSTGYRARAARHPYQQHVGNAAAAMAEPNQDWHEEQEPAEERRIWRIVAHSPLDSLWHLHGIRVKRIARRAWKSILQDRVFGRAAELGFYFIFSLFPALFCVGSIFGMVVRSSYHIYGELLSYLALVIPGSAMSMVLSTVHQTARGASFGKITFSFLGAIWSASMGLSAVQDTLNDVYKIPDTRSYLGARIKAIGLTIVVTAIFALSLAAMFGGDFFAGIVASWFSPQAPHRFIAIGIRIVAWSIATALLVLTFAVIYYWAPEWRKRRWRWLTPGSAFGVLGWLIASLGLRFYLHFFNNYSVTYGSLGAVIILLTWFYITGLMLLVGGEINSEIEAAAVERRLRNSRKKKKADSQEAA